MKPITPWLVAVVFVNACSVEIGAVASEPKLNPKTDAAAEPQTGGTQSAVADSGLGGSGGQDPMDAATDSELVGDHHDAGTAGTGGSGGTALTCADLAGVWKNTPDTCGTAPSKRCETIATKKNIVRMIKDVITVDSASCPGRTRVVAKFVEPQGCGTVNYPCGDIRKGGLDPNGPTEKWAGSICEVYALGDNTFEFHLDGNTGSKNFQLPEGPADDTYVWHQCCDPNYKPLCGWWQ